MDAELRHLPRTATAHTRLAVMGVPVLFEASHDAVLDAVSSWLSARRGPDAPPTSPVGPDRDPVIQLLLEDAPFGADAPPSFRSRSRQILEIRGPGFAGHADGDAFLATCSFTPGLLRDTRRFEEAVLATLTLFLVTRRDRIPFHAAAIARAGHSLLLAGPSGSGKSTLAYAAMRRGWTVLSDDAVYLQSRPEPRIWTAPGRLHLTPDTVRWFAELAGQDPILRGNGTTKIPVDRPDPQYRPDAGRVSLVLVQKGEAAPELRPADPESAIGQLLRDLDPGFDVFRDSTETPLRALVRNDVWILRTGEPERTIEVLEQRIGGIH